MAVLLDVVHNHWNPPQDGVWDFDGPANAYFYTDGRADNRRACREIDGAATIAARAASVEQLGFIVGNGNHRVAHGMGGSGDGWLVWQGLA